jgi:uncharacterized protein YuzE
VPPTSSGLVIEMPNPLDRERPVKLEFDPEADAAYFEISPVAVVSTREIEPGIFGDYDEAGHLVGVEVLSVSKRARLPELDEAA